MMKTCVQIVPNNCGLKAIYKRTSTAILVDSTWYHKLIRMNQAGLGSRKKESESLVMILLTIIFILMVYFNFTFTCSITPKMN